MTDAVKTVEEYVSGLPDDRRQVVSQMIDLVRRNLPAGYEESMEWGMPTYQVPLSAYPDTYNKRPLMYAAVAAQKNHFAVYLTAPYIDPDIKHKLEQGFERTGKKLDMGASCLRFKSLSDLPMDVVGEVIASMPMDKFIKVSKQARTSQK